MRTKEQPSMTNPLFLEHLCSTTLESQKNRIVQIEETSGYN